MQSVYACFEKRICTREQRIYVGMDIVFCRNKHMNGTPSCEREHLNTQIYPVKKSICLLPIIRGSRSCHDPSPLLSPAKHWPPMTRERRIVSAWTKGIYTPHTCTVTHARPTSSSDMCMGPDSISSSSYISSWA